MIAFENTTEPVDVPEGIRVAVQNMLEAHKAFTLAVMEEQDPSILMTYLRAHHPPVAKALQKMVVAEALVAIEQLKAQGIV